MGRWIAITLGVVLALAGVASCGRPGRAPGPLRVVVTLPPLQSLVRPLLPQDAELRVLMAPGRSEHGYEFSPEDLVALGKADIVVLVGMMLEPKVEQFLDQHPDPRRRVVEFAKVIGVEAGHEGHDHDGHDHAHGAEDPHLWLDPILVTQLIPAVADAVTEAERGLGGDPTPPGDRAKAAAGLVSDRVLAVDDAYRTGLAPFQGRGIVTHHAAWGRLAARYGLTVAEVLRPVESVEPDAAHTAAVVEALRKAGTGVLFVEPAYDRRSAERIAAAAGARVMTLDPLGQGDWEAMMRSNLAALLEAFTPTPPTTTAPAGDPRP